MMPQISAERICAELSKKRKLGTGYQSFKEKLALELQSEKSAKLESMTKEEAQKQNIFNHNKTLLLSDESLYCFF